MTKETEKKQTPYLPDNYDCRGERVGPRSPEAQAYYDDLFAEAKAALSAKGKHKPKTAT